MGGQEKLGIFRPSLSQLRAIFLSMVMTPLWCQVPLLALRLDSGKTTSFTGLSSEQQVPAIGKL